jgi:hypothetical protein
MPGILLATGYACLLLFLTHRMRFFNSVPGLPWRHVAWLFVLKICAGTALWWIYSHVYPDRPTADIFKYFDDAMVLFSALPEHPGDYLRMITGLDPTPHISDRYYMVMNNWYRQYEGNLYNDSHTMIRFNALVRLISFGEIHVHTVVAAFLATTGMVGLYRTFVKWLAGRERALMAAIFLLPSVLLWASGVIKESLLYFGLGLVLYQLFKMLDGRIRAGGVLILLAGLFLLLHLKYYVLMSLMPSLLLYAWCRMTGGAVTWRALVIYGTTLVLALNLHLILPGYHVLGLLALRQKDFIGLATGTDSGSFVMPPILEPGIWSFVINAPYALYITFMAPMIHFRGVLGTLSAVENVLVLAVVIIMLLHARPWRQVDRPLALALLGYVLVLALIIGWTTPVMGAVVRYRSPLLPFLLVLVLLMFDHQRFLARWPALRPFISA